MAETALDHIILHVPFSWLAKPPKWLSESFTLLSGGKHSQGLSANSLICFRDGVYLELFAWVGEPYRPFVWGTRKDGLIDYAITTSRQTTKECWVNVMQRLEVAKANVQRDDVRKILDVKFETPEEGMRRREDGVEVRWESSRPILAKPTDDIIVPFLVHDLTDRNIRVPFDDEKVTTHKCGAIGIAGVEILVPKGRIEDYATLYTAVTGLGGQKVGKAVVYKVPTRPVDIGLDPPEIVIREPDNEEDEEWLKERGIGIRSITLNVESDNTYGVVKLGEEDIASTLKLKYTERVSQL